VARRKGQRKKLTLGWVLLFGVVVVVVGVGYLAYSVNAPIPGFPFPCVGSEGTALHVHPILQIFINGENVTIPGGIGIPPGHACLEPIHTHDSTGTIHIESPDTTTQYTLGEFFQIWSATYSTVTVGGTAHPVVFNSTDILGFRADSAHKITMLVNGAVSTEYGSLVLNSLDGEIISIEYASST
jgi:hypothetical protein